MQIKYMGNADVRRLEKGENFGGRLNKDAALDRDIEWNWDNDHVIDTSDFDGVDDEFWELLLDKSMDGEFKDVSGLKRVPTNAAQQMWRGMAKSEEADPSVKDSGTAETDETSQSGGGVSEASDQGNTPAPVGGAAKKAGARASTAT